MDYEKKYKEALERAKVIYQGSYKPDTAATIAETLQNVFPELCESEDEKIRKGLIKLVKATQSDELWGEYCVSKADALAWLEKQGKEDSFIQQAYEQGYTEGKRIERKHWIEKQNFSEDYNSIEQFGKPIEQNPAEWSEEDESWFKELELMALSFSNDVSYLKKFFDWLKFLKDRVQPKQKWSEEDEVKINRIVACLENLNVADNDILLKDVDWLKSLKGRVLPQPKYEWSEEDEYNFKLTLRTIELDQGLSVKTIKKLHSWLKSIKERYTWKPSDEQIMALEWQLKNTSENSWQYKETKELFEQLKTIK